jgi:type VI secretion system VasD/TssJ family lipoprotein
MAEKFPLLAALVIIACATAACSSSPPKPSAVKARIAASADVNPRPEGGGAQPVHVRVFQLKDDSVFMASDFWALVDKPKETLGAGLIQQLQFDLTPGAQQQLELKLDPDAHVLAVLAEFADYRNTDGHWRAVSPTPVKSMLDIVKRKKRIVIEVDRASVGIRVGD